MKFLALLFLVSCVYESKVSDKVATYTPKFKVGDCAASRSRLENPPEFLEQKIEVEKIIKVGTRNYLYQYGNFGKIEFPIQSYDNIMVKVKCPKGL